MADDTATPELTEDKLEQNVTIEDAGPARKKIAIEIPESRIGGKLEQNFADLRGEAVIPGFRRGRAPQRLIEKRFGSDVRNEVKTQLLAESYQQVIEENELRVIGEPDVKDAESIELPESGPLSFEVEIEIVPEFEVPDLKGLEVTKTKIAVGDDQVGTEIERFCEMQGQMKAHDGKVAEQDYLTADVTIKNAEGETVKEEPGLNIYVPGESRKFKGVVAGILVEKLGKELIGKKTGDAVTVTATGPKQHEDEALREAELTIDIAISRTERMEPAKVEDLLPMFGFENEDALREQIKSNLEQRGEAEQQSEMHKQVSEKLADLADFELPEGLTGRQAERLLQRRQLDLMYKGASPQDIEEQLAELRSAAEADAQKELKTFFILDKVAEQMEVEVGEGEINGRIAQMAVQQGRRPEKLRHEMARSGQLEQLFIQLREQKTIDKILEDAKVTEVEPEAKPEAAKKTTKKKTSKKTTKKKTTKKKTTKKKSSS